MATVVEIRNNTLTRYFTNSHEPFETLKIHLNKHNINTLNEFMKMEKISMEIWLFYEELVLRWRTLACSLLAQKYFEYFPLLLISPSPPEIEIYLQLFLGQGQRYQKRREAEIRLFIV